jgi:glutathione synthase/RimK-type ligase-like ATP-grasp enzyme
MKIAIHKRIDSYSERWVEYCEKNNISYKLVNAYGSDIIADVDDCDVFMWNHAQHLHKDALTAKNVIFSLEHAGITVFPDFKTTWHFDDKVAQKYLLEAIKAPMVASYVFYDEIEALHWLEEQKYPVVFKLKRGAGSSNVRLLHSFKESKSVVKRAFKNGFEPFKESRLTLLNYRIKNFKDGQGNFLGLLKAFYRFVFPKFGQLGELHQREKGYVYFQDFIPNNLFDIRVVVVGNRAFALKRLVRDNDFRASGSGKIVYDKNQIDLRCIKIAFEVNNKLQTQSIAYDFVFDEQHNPLIIEISYGYAISAYDICEGFWDENLNWYDEKVTPQHWIIEDLIKSLKK